MKHFLKGVYTAFIPIAFIQCLMIWFLPPLVALVFAAIAFFVGIRKIRKNRILARNSQDEYDEYTRRQSRWVFISGLFFFNVLPPIVGSIFNDSERDIAVFSIIYSIVLVLFTAIVALVKTYPQKPANQHHRRK